MAVFEFVFLSCIFYRERDIAVAAPSYCSLCFIYFTFFCWLLVNFCFFGDEVRDERRRVCASFLLHLMGRGTL